MRKSLANMQSQLYSLLLLLLCVSMPLAVTGSLDGTANIWDVTTMRLRQTVRHDVSIWLCFR
jgi:WD40 repeat protein